MRKVKEEKFARYIQKELGYIFLQHVKFVGKSTFTSVTRVIASPDKGYVKVYLSFLNEKDPQKALDDIKLYTKEIRVALAQRIRNHVRKIPELSFFYDDTMDYVDKMEEVFRKINNESNPAESGDN